MSTRRWRHAASSGDSEFSFPRVSRRTNSGGYLVERCVGKRIALPTREAVAKNADAIVKAGSGRSSGTVRGVEPHDHVRLSADPAQDRACKCSVIDERACIAESDPTSPSLARSVWTELPVVAKRLNENRQ
jgi:hypothetical protein